MGNAYVHELFEKLHAMPEVGFEERKTSAFLADELEKYGYRVTRNVGGKTGVIGVLEGKQPGPVIAIRADMDALPFEVDGKTVAIHACGHDAHSSMVMSVARGYAESGLERGKLIVVFQPAEEIDGGSMSIVESGLLDGIDEIVGAHIRPASDFPFGFVTPGLYHSAAANPRMKIRGKNAHGANPHMGTNAIDAAALVIAAANAIRGNPAVRHSLKPTKIADGGNAINTIPDEIVLGFDIRSHDNAEMERLIASLRTAATSAAASVSATVELEPVPYSEAAVYDEGMKNTAREAIVEILGADKCVPDLYVNGGEDFHKYTIELGCRAIYIGIGADAKPGLHHKDMTFNHKAMEYGRDILRRILEKRFAGSAR